MKQNVARKNASHMQRQRSVRQSQDAFNEDFLKTPQGGFAQNARESIRGKLAIGTSLINALILNEF